MPADTQDQPVSADERAGLRTRWAWYSYDFGNTAVEFAIPLYLTIWIVSDLGVKAWVFGLASALSSWAIGLSGPYIGVSADERHTRRRWFVASAVVAAVLLGSLSFQPRSGTTAVITILVAAMVANYSFQLSSLIYNASMLNAAGGSNVVSVSSRGMALSFAGGAVGVAIMESIVSGRLIPGVSGRSYALLPAAIIFIACCLPGIYAPKLWQKKTDVVEIPPGRLHQRMAQLWRESATKYKAGWFLGGYFALNSAIMGLTLYLPLHVQAVTGLEGIPLLSMFASVVIMSAVGAAVVALMKPTKVMVRKIILVGLTLLGLNAFAFSLVSALPLVLLFSSLHGLFSGALVPTVRGAFAQTFRSDYQALAFGLFGAVQRTSQGLGALLSPLASAATGSGATSAGIAAMGVVALIGVPLFARWRLMDTAATDAGPLADPAAQTGAGGHPPAGD
jgi:MFS-type transporter involved in bile tolerance (Atg22 family)